MAVDCALEPGLVAFVKAFGTTFALVAAAAAWLLNRFLGWCVWEAGRFIERFELMKAIRAEIADNLRSEEAYADAEGGERLIATLEQLVPPGGALAPYVAVDDRNVIFEETAKSLRLLPFGVIESVVAYYSASSGLTRQLLDFGSDAFKAIGPIRQKAVIVDAFKEGAEVVALGRVAQTRIEEKFAVYRAIVAAVAGAGLVVALAAAYGLARAAPPFVASISEAVGWASTCDLAPTSANTTSHIRSEP
jgi:hypothetical protein